MSVLDFHQAIYIYYKEMRFFKEEQFSLQSIHFNQKVVVHRKQQKKAHCVIICIVPFQNVTFLSKHLSWPFSLNVAPFPQKNVALLSKKPSFHMLLEGTPIVRRKGFAHQNWISDIFWKLHHDLNICNNPFNHTISVSTCNARVKELQLRSTGTGTTFNGFLHQEYEFTFPKASHLKRKLAHPDGMQRIFSIQDFLKYCTDFERITWGQDESDLVWINLDKS